MASVGVCETVGDRGDGGAGEELGFGEAVDGDLGAGAEVVADVADEDHRPAGRVPRHGQCLPVRVGGAREGEGGPELPGGAGAVDREHLVGVAAVVDGVDDAGMAGARGESADLRQARGQGAGAFRGERPRRRPGLRRYGGGAGAGDAAACDSGPGRARLTVAAAAAARDARSRGMGTRWGRRPQLPRTAAAASGMDRCRTGMARRPPVAGRSSATGLADGRVVPGVGEEGAGRAAQGASGVHDADGAQQGRGEGADLGAVAEGP